MNEDKISIIIPVHNGEKYLRECLDSVLAQSYVRIETIIIDDASTDKTAEICKEYCKIDNRFFYYRNVLNGGSSASRNKGVRYATGNYISFIDADDIVEKDFCEELIHNVYKYDADISVCNFIIDGQIEKIARDEVINKDNIFQAYIDGKITNRCMNKLYRKGIVKSVVFPEGRDYREDAVFTPLALEKSTRIACSSSGKYHYRMVPNSLVHQKMNLVNSIARTRNEWECLLIVLRNVSEYKNPNLAKLMERVIFNTFSCQRQSLNDEQISYIERVIESYRDAFKEIGGIAEEIAEVFDANKMSNFSFIQTILFSKNVETKKKLAILMKRHGFL